MRKTTNRFIAMILSLTMVFMSIPVTSFAGIWDGFSAGGQANVQAADDNIDYVSRTLSNGGSETLMKIDYGYFLVPYVKGATIANKVNINVGATGSLLSGRKIVRGLLSVVSAMESFICTVLFINVVAVFVLQLV